MRAVVAEIERVLLPGADAPEAGVPHRNHVFPRVFRSGSRPSETIQIFPPMG